jgi:hypothetical protein
MKLAEIKAMNNEKLVSQFHWCTIRGVHETNSVRGITQKTLREEQWILDELCKRFNLDKEIMEKELNR